jgi:hypothetical protein
LRTKDVGRDAKSCYVFFVATTVGIPMRGDASWIFLPPTMFHANPRMKKQLDSVVRKILEDVEFAEVQDYPEFVDLEFSVDIMEPGNSSEINAEGLAFNAPSEPSRSERPSRTDFLNASDVSFDLPVVQSGSSFL